MKDRESIHQCVKDSDIVVNLIAQDRNSWYVILFKLLQDYPCRNFKIDEVNIEGALRLAEICQTAGVRKLIHVSSLLAQPDSSSKVQRSKYHGESCVRRIFPESTIVRPSQLFGHEDRLMNLIGVFSAIPFGYPVVNHGKAMRYPLYVGDFAEGLFRLCRERDGRFDGKTFDFLGSKAFAQRQLIEYFMQQTLRHHPIINMPPLAMFMYSRMFPEWRRPIYTRDSIKELFEDEKATNGHLRLSDLGLTQLQQLDDLSVSFLRGFRPVFAYTMPHISSYKPQA